MNRPFTSQVTMIGSSGQACSRPVAVSDDWIRITSAVPGCVYHAHSHIILYVPSHTPGFVLVTDITVTIAMAVPAVNTYVKINMYMIVQAFGKNWCRHQAGNAILL